VWLALQFAMMWGSVFFNNKANVIKKSIFLIPHNIKIRVNTSWKIDYHLKSGEGTHGRRLGLLLGSDVGYKVICSVLFADDANTREISHQHKTQIRKE
jgi:hypothetical protein